MTADFLGHLRAIAEYGREEVLMPLRQVFALPQALSDQNVLEYIHKHLFINKIINISF